MKVDIDTTVNSRLADLSDTIWDKEEVPKTWKQGLIVELPKKCDVK